MSFKSSLLKLADAFAGPVACGLLSRTQKTAEHRHADQVEGPVLVIRPGGIGDGIMLIPTLHALRKALPGRPIDILCEARNQEIFKLALPECKTMAYDKTPLAALRMLRHEGYECVIDTEQFHNFSGVMAALTRAPLRIGFKINTHRRGLYTHSVSYDLDGREDVQFGRLLSAALGREVSLPPRFGIIDAAALPEFPEHLLPSGKFIALHAGGSIPCKRAPVKELANACYAVESKLDLKTVIIGSPADCGYAAELASEIGNGVINRCGRLSLAQTAALCSKATVLLGPDSGIAHLAVAVGTPAIVLFGPSDPAKWGPPEGYGETIQVQLPCSPCSIFGYTKPCLNYECMTNIKSQPIIEALCRAAAKENFKS